MVNQLSVALPACSVHMSISISLDKLLFPRYARAKSDVAVEYNDSISAEW